MTSVVAKKRYDSMLFNYETTDRTDFRDGRIRPIFKTEYKTKPTCVRVRPPPQKDIQTLTDWHEPNVPFDLMHNPKDIVRTNPWDLQKPHKEPEDLIREEAQRTRPRLVITPAVSMDDVEPAARKVLIKDLYTTTVMQMMRESGIELGSSVRAPLPDRPAPANPITLQPLTPPYVSPEWRMDSAAWDNRQLRAFCNPTREFWLHYEPKYKCEVCEDTAQREESRARRLAKQR